MVLLPSITKQIERCGRVKGSESTSWLLSNLRGTSCSRPAGRVYSGEELVACDNCGPVSCLEGACCEGREGLNADDGKVGEAEGAGEVGEAGLTAAIVPDSEVPDANVPCSGKRTR